VTLADRAKAEQRAESLEQMLDAAEELFSRHGLYGVTLKDVAQKVGVHTSLMHYYFKDKQDLFDQVVRRRAPVTIDRRMEALERYERDAGDKPTVEGALHAFLDTDLDLYVEGGEPWMNYAAFCARVSNTPEGAALRSPSGRKYDAVANCAAGVAWPALKAVLADEGGTAADVTPGVRAALTSLLHKVTFAKKRLAPLMLTPRMEEMEWLVELARQGKLRTVVDSRYPLSRAQEAWAKSADGHATGKIVVEIGGAE
jgi:AcrR family transcriptional regulator